MDSTATDAMVATTNPMIATQTHGGTSCSGFGARFLRAYSLAFALVIGCSLKESSGSECTKTGLKVHGDLFKFLI